MKKRYKIAILDTHFAQYRVPLYRVLAKHKEIGLIVYYCSKFGIKEYYDPGFNKKISWKDTYLTKEYKYEFLKNYSPKPSVHSFFGLINPGIIKELFENNYDAILIHGYQFLTNFFGFLGAWITKTPILFRGETDLLKKEPIINKILKKTLIKTLFKKIDAFLYSYSKNKEFYKHYGVPERKLFFHPCAVDNDFFQKKAKELKRDRIKIRKNLKIPKEAIVILFVAKLIPRKRPMDLIKAYELLQNKKVYLVFVGDGLERKKIENYIKKKKLKNILLVGFENQSELPAYYTIADIFVLPSEYDPSPKAMNEAMNFSLPIVTTNKVGTAYDLIKNGENGFIYPVGDIKKLSDYLLRLIKNSELIKKMGRKSLEIVSEWNFDKDVEGIIKALNNL